MLFSVKKIFNTFLLLIRYVGIICIFSHCGYVYAYDLSITPSVTTQGIYSDNIKLLPSGQEQGAIVSEVSPGVSIMGQSARSKLDLNYRMQNLYNAGRDSNVTTYNQLQYNSHNTLFQNRLFLDSRSTLSQQNVSNTQTANDNISGAAGSKTNVSTFTMSPYWTPHFQNYADGNLRLNFDAVTTSSSSNNNSTTIATPISNTINLGEIIQLNSGTEFKRINWNLSYNNAENYRQGVVGENVKLENSSATVRTYLNQYFNVFTTGGYSNNSYQSTINNNGNGFSYTFGGQWKPSQYYSIEVGGGNNSYVTVAISPMQRLSWSTTFRDNAVGLNSGKTWQTALNFRTMRSTWSLTHDNDTTTAQEILLKLQTFTTQDSSGNTIINPVTQQPVQYAINIPTLTNDVIVTKTWGFSSTFNTGKTTLGANASNQDRVDQLSGLNETVRSLSATWNWQFASRTSAYIHPLWQQTIDNGININNRYDLSIGINRSITSRINGKLELRHVNQMSNSNTNGLQSIGLNTNDYQENRATASLFMRY